MSSNYGSGDFELKLRMCGYENPSIIISSDSDEECISTCIMDNKNYPSPSISCFSNWKNQLQHVVDAFELRIRDLILEKLDKNYLKLSTDEKIVLLRKELGILQTTYDIDDEGFLDNEQELNTYENIFINKYNS